MSEFKPRKLLEVVSGVRDVLHGGVASDALYSVKLQNETPDLNAECNCYYICTQGLGFSIEIQGKLELGKFTEDELRDMLNGRVYIESSVENSMSFSPELCTLVEACHTFKLVELRSNPELEEPTLIVLESRNEEEVKVIKVWTEGDVIRPLETMLHWIEHSAHRVSDMTESGLAMFCGVHKDLPASEWPEPNESIVLLHQDEKIHVTYDDYISYIIPVLSTYASDYTPSQ